MALTAAAVDTAIETIESTGQNVTVDGLSYGLANLDALIRLRDKLANETLRSNGRRPMFRGMDFRGAGYGSYSDSSDIVKVTT